MRPNGRGWSGGVVSIRNAGGFLTIWLLIFGASALLCGRLAWAETVVGMNPAEKWVAGQVTAGMPADLRQQFPDEKDRKLGAGFLADLLTGRLPGVTAQAPGIRISGAVIDESIDLSNAQIPCEVWLDYCQFSGTANFSCASFAQNASFAFTTFKGDATFDATKVGQTASFHNAVFEGGAWFKNAVIGADFLAPGAQFKDTINGAIFQSMTVGHLAKFEKADFAGPVNFEGANIGGDLEAPGARFHDKQQWADFACAKVGQVAIFDDAVFEGPVNFAAMDIGVDFTASGTQFQDKANGAFFIGMKVGQTASFHDATFQGPVSFQAANMSCNFIASGAKFEDTRQGAVLTGMKVDQVAIFDNAVFEGPVNFTGAEVDGNFQARWTRFRDKGTGAIFNAFKVGQTAFFDDAVFEGPVDSKEAEFDGNLQATDAQFLDTQTGANFDSMKVEKHAIFDGALFKGPANFTASEIDGEFQARNARFQQNGKGTDFHGIKIGEQAIFEEAEFDGSVDFSAANVAGSFDMYLARFTGRRETIQFSMNCDRKGIFQSTTFAGMVSFIDSSFFDLIISGTAGAAPIPVLDLSRASVKGYLAVWGAGIHNLIAESLKVEGPAKLTAIEVDDSADLSDSSFVTLDLSLSSWPKGAGEFHLQDMDYQCLRLYPTPNADESASHKELLKLADQAAFTSDVYGSLEAFFLRQGYSEDADKAFIAGKRRERREAFGRGEYWRWLGGMALDCLVGYGRRPWYAEVEGAIVVALGCFLFSPGKMEPQNKHESARGYNRFWYSLGLFLPGVDLQAEKVWKPKEGEVFLRNYKHVQILLGWILIPIVLVALTGLIK